jgi:hypothetical protein
MDNSKQIQNKTQIQIPNPFSPIREKITHNCHTKQRDAEFQTPCMHDFAAIVAPLNPVIQKKQIHQHA